MDVTEKVEFGLKTTNRRSGDSGRVIGIYSKQTQNQNTTLV